MILALLVSCQGESTIIGGNSLTVAQLSIVVLVEIDTFKYIINIDLPSITVFTAYRDGKQVKPTKWWPYS